MTGTTLDDYTDRYAHRVNGMTASEIRALFAVANRPDDLDLREEPRREGEVDRRAAEHAVTLPEGGSHGVKRDRAHDRQRHGRAS